MWADNETALDLINVRHLVRGVRDTITDDRLLPVTVGVFGGWGQGKSSLIRMIEAELADTDGVLCVSFNGWLFESYDDAKSALMETILEKIAAERTLSAKGKKLFKRLTKRIDWFRTMSLAGKGALTLATGGAAGVAGLGLIELASLGLRHAKESEGADLDELLSLLKKERGVGDENHIQTVRGFRQEFEDLLVETHIKKLVVFIDELDRCLPAAVVETLEAIRLFLFVPQTAFVIGADEELVSHAVGLRFRSEGLETSFGRRYLEKMIQIPFRIPDMGPWEMRTYMNLLFTELALEPEKFEELVDQLLKEARGDLGEIKFGYDLATRMLDPLSPDLAENFVLTDQLSEILSRGLKGNPRQLKRFLNMLLLRMKLGEYRGLVLERRVLGKLMLLEYFHPERFRELALRQAGAGREILARLESRVRANDELDGATPEDQDNADDRSDTEDGNGVSGAAKRPDSNRDAGEWLSEPDLVDWLGLDPPLGGIDLRPYFYVSRDQTGPVGTERGALSPSALEVLRALRSDAKLARARGVSQLKGLSVAEAAAVLAAVSEDIRRAESLKSASKPPLASLLGLVEARSDLHSELVPLLRSIPAGRLPVSLAPALETHLQNTNPRVLETIATLWIEKSAENEALAAAAQQMLTRLKEEA